MKIIVIGGGPAGITTAISLARENVDVVVLEAGPYCGATGGGNGVYDARHLAEPDLLGDRVEEDGPWKRNIRRREQYVYDGGSLTGISYDNPDAFKDCYAVDRPTFDRWVANQARNIGARVETNTTAKSLIRRNNRVIGIHTNRGPLYGDGVFIAEGDVAELTQREEFERIPPSQSPPYFLAIREQLAVNRDQIETYFGLGDQTAGTAREIHMEAPLDWTGTVRGTVLPLRERLALEILVPIDSARGYGTSSHSLMEWFKSRPFLKPITDGGETVRFSAGVVRDGRGRMPHLVDHGVGIGGGAAGLSVLYPHLNDTAPATFSGQLFARAVKSISEQGDSLSRNQLRREYVDPLKNSGYVKTNQFLREQSSDSLVDNSFPTPSLINGICSIVSDSSTPSLDLSKLFSEFSIRSLIKIAIDHRNLLFGLSDLFGGNTSEETEAHGTVRFHRQSFYPNGQDGFPEITETFLNELAEPASLVSDHLYSDETTPLGDRLEQGWIILKETIPARMVRTILVGLFRYGLMMPINVIRRGIGTESFYEDYVDYRETEMVSETTEIDVETIRQKFENTRIRPGKRAPAVVYGTGFMEDSTRWDTTSEILRACPTDVYEFRDQPPGITIHTEQCIRCGGCRHLTLDVEWSGLTDHQAWISRPEETSQKNNAPPDDFTAEPYGGQTIPEKNIPDTSRVPELLHGLRVQLEGWINEFDRLPTSLDPDHVRWSMTRARSILTTLELLGDELDHGPDVDSDLKVVLGKMTDTLEKTQQQIANRHLFHGRDLVEQVRDHHLRFLENVLPEAERFEFPLHAFWRREQDLDPPGIKDSAEASNPIESSRPVVREFLAETMDHFPHDEIFGEEVLPGVDIEKDLKTILLPDSGTMDLPAFERLGGAEVDDPLMTSVVNLSDTEQHIWKEAGRYNVITDVIERWRQWSREVPRIGNHDDPGHRPCRGQLIGYLWLTRKAINRVHARLMTGLPSELAVGILRCWVKEVEQFKQQTEVSLRNSDQLIGIGETHKNHRADANGSGENSPPEYNTNKAVGESFITHPARYPALSGFRPAETDDMPEEYHEQRLARCGKVASIIGDWLDAVETAGLSPRQRRQLGHVILDWVSITSIHRQLTGLRPMLSSDDKDLLTGLAYLAGEKRLDRVRRLTKSFSDELSPSEPPPVSTDKIHKSVLRTIEDSYVDTFKKHEDPELPDEHLEPMYDLVQNRVVRSTEQFGEQLWTGPKQERVFFHDLSDMLADYLATISVYRHRDALRDQRRETSSLRIFYEEVAPMVRRTVQQNLNHLNGVLGQITEGANHRVTPPELLVTKRIQDDSSK